MDLEELEIASQSESEAKQRKKQSQKAAIVGLILNILLAIFKIVAGFLAGSVAITADGWNNVSDSFSSIVSLISINFANKAPNEKYPFGYARIEYIASTLIAFGMLFVSINLGRQSIERIINPAPLNIALVSYLALIVSIIIKGFMFVYYRIKSKRLSSPVMKATAIDSLTDTISTAAVLISTILFSVAGYNIDGIAGLIVSIFILWSAIDIIRDMSKRLLGSKPSKALNEYISKLIINSDPKVIGVHDLIVHDYGPGKMFASAHVEIDSRESFVSSHLLLDKIERELLEEHGMQVVLHADPASPGDPFNQELSVLLHKIANKINPDIGIHDVQQFSTKYEEVLTFHVSLPDNCTLSDDEVSKIFQDELSKKYPQLSLVVSIQRAYQTRNKDIIAPNNKKRK